MKTLIAVESPHKAKVIQGFLGSSYIVLPTVGHFKEMPIPKNMTPAQKKKYGDYSLDFANDFEPLFKTSPGSQKVVSSFKAALKKVDEVVIGTDSDNEGALIGLLLVQELKTSLPTYRATWNEITKTAVTEGLAKKKLIDSKKRLPEDFFNTAESALTRGSWDRLYGFSTSPYLWRTIKGGLALHEDTLIPTWEGGSADSLEPTSMWQKDLEKLYTDEESFYYGNKKENFLFEDETTFARHLHKRLKDIEVSDLVIGPDGKATKVLEKYKAVDESFEITFDHGRKTRKIKASGGHLWAVLAPNERLKSPSKSITNKDWRFSSLTIESIELWAENEDWVTSTNIYDFLSASGPRVSSSRIKEMIVDYARAADLPSCSYAFQKKVVLDVVQERHFKREYHRRLWTDLINNAPFFEVAGETLLLRSLSDSRLKRLFDEVVKSTEGVINFIEYTYLFNKDKTLEFLSSLLPLVGIPSHHILFEREENQNGLKTFSTKELYQLYNSGFSGKVSIPTVSTKYPEAVLPIDPYTLGLWLGDGDSSREQVCGLKTDLVEYQKFIPYNSFYTEKRSRKPDQGHIVIEGLREKLRALGVARLDKDKRSMKQIPEVYFRSSVEQRVELIAGVVDTDGSVHHKDGRIAIYNTNYHLILQLVQMLESLGIKPSVLEKWRKNPSERVIYVVQWNYTPDCPPFARLPRKAKRLHSSSHKNDSHVNQRYIYSIKKIPTEGDYFCLKVDNSDGLFLTESYIMTHNSSGRVQVPGARLVVERELKRLSHFSVSFYSITGEFEGTDATLVEIEGKKIATGANIDDDGNIADGYLLITDDNIDKTLTFLESKDYRISDVKSRPYRKSPPPPFTTSSALQSIGGKTGMSSKHITSIFQHLYQEGFITYIRTVSVVVAPDAVTAARATIVKVHGNKFLPAKPRVYKDKKAENSGHEAIRPVLAGPQLLHKTFSDSKHQKVFDTIYNRMLASQAIDQEGMTWTASFSSKEDDAKFNASETLIDEPGWTVIYGADD